MLAFMFHWHRTSAKWNDEGGWVDFSFRIQIQTPRKQCKKPKTRKIHATIEWFFVLILKLISK